jgi:hypothetical protein
MARRAREKDEIELADALDIASAHVDRDNACDRYIKIG